MMTNRGTDSNAGAKPANTAGADTRAVRPGTIALGFVMLLAPLFVGAKGCNPTVEPCGGIAGVKCAEGQYCNFAPETKCGSGDQMGVCAAIPQACPDIYKPVCGCNGKTYGNACEAAAAGISVASEGACTPTGTTCGGLIGAICPRGEYCDFPQGAFCGRADATGTCKTIPTGCTKEYNPVCGCDGTTYGNACTAAAAGVSVEHTGECGGGGGTTCGGIAALQCDAGQFCNYDDGKCGNAFPDQAGVCTVIPQICPQIFKQVCGCNGKTYTNSCYAAGAGVSVAHDGPCSTAGAACGSRGLPACGTADYCNFPRTANCGRADAPGVCAPKPQGCTAVVAPVCGCDGTTYNNACYAAVAGVSVEHTGACAAVP